MAKVKLTEDDLKRELHDWRDRFPNINLEEIFIGWFLRAYVTDDDNAAISSLCGGPKDKGVDAVLIDDASKKVFIVQGKYHAKLMTNNESRPDVQSFSKLAPDLVGDVKNFRTLGDDMAPDVFSRLSKAREKILKQKYRLQLLYVTTGKASKDLKKEAHRIVKSADCESTFELVDGNRILAILDYYLLDVAPPVSSLDLEIEAGNGVDIRSIFHRYDSKLNIESWVFSMMGRDIAQMYKQAGRRLFALNIRGYQGDDTNVNEGMKKTIEKSPEYFWYYNNGLTIICDNAERVTSNGRDILRVSSPQVINGQQTTRTLYEQIIHNSKASATVRVIRVPHTMNEGTDHFDELVSQIVKSTNWQNSIVASDLISNDRRQIKIHRRFRNLGYWYARKRQSVNEHKIDAGGKQYKIISKTDVAQAVAGCDLDPSIVRNRGKEKLFDEKMYGTIFPTDEPYYYLQRYWLMKEVEYPAKGYPQRGYAKWLVLNFMWKEFSRYVNSSSRRRLFESEWRVQRGDSIVALWKAINIVYQAALQFYKLNRGTGATAKDVSNFFKLVNLHVEFENFWNSSKNKHKTKFKSHMQKFELALIEDNE